MARTTTTRLARMPAGRPSIVPRVVADVRRYVRDQALLPGDQLPSEPALAAELGVSCMTLRKALEKLGQEDVLDRQRGVGTFVKRTVTSTVGVAFTFDSLRSTTHGFARWVLGSARDWLEAHGMTMRLLMRDDQGLLDPDALEAVRGHAIDGVLLRYDNRGPEDVSRRLSGQGIPVVGLLAHPDAPGTEYWAGFRPDYGPAVAALARRGHARAALAGSSFSDYTYSRDCAMRAARKHGLVLDGKTLAPARCRDTFDAVAEGRALARTWLGLDDHPPALIFSDHYVCQGFQYELIEAQGSVAGMPQMCVHEAAEFVLDLPCPVIRVHYDATPTIHLTCEMLHRLLLGLPVRPKGVAVDTHPREVTWPDRTPVKDHREELAAV